MARTLADGKTKFTIVTTAPVNPAAPTATELNAGIDLSCDILTSDFNWTNADSDTVGNDQKALCEKGNPPTYGSSNYNLGVTLFRQFDRATGAPTEDELGWTAIKEKGSEVWGYARETGKDSTEEWAADDEIYLGGRVMSDAAQRIDGTGFIRRRVPLGAQSMHENITVAAAAV